LTVLSTYKQLINTNKIAASCYVVLFLHDLSLSYLQRSGNPLDFRLSNLQQRFFLFLYVVLKQTTWCQTECFVQSVLYRHIWLVLS